MDIVFDGVKKKVEFTLPQAAIIKRLQGGEKTTIVNAHRMSGGEFVWYKQDGDYSDKEFVGCRAFNGAMFAIRKAFSLNSEAENRLYSQFIV